MLRVLIILPFAAAVAACGSTSASDPATATGPAPATTNALAGTPMATYGHDLNKAKHVQNVVNDAAVRQAREIDGPASAASSN